MKKILKPNLKDKLIICGNIEKLINDETIYDYKITDCIIDYEYNKLAHFDGCYFKKVKFITSYNIDVKFINCIFEDCDFSNFKMANSLINQTTFNNCKLYGIDLSISDIRDVIFINTNLSFGNFTNCRMDYCNFSNCDMQNSFLDSVRFKDAIFKETNLCFSEVIHTSLKNINLSDSKISGIKINLSDLRGVIVNEYQALEFVSLLGIKIDR